MRKALILSGLVMVLFVGKSMAQAEGSTYSTAVGLKFAPATISVKHFISDDAALEGLGQFWNGFRVTGLYEVHQDFLSAEGLKWYYGAGAHIGWYNDWWHDDHHYSSGSLALGADAVLGLEYKFDGAPIAISADIQPFLDLAPRVYLGLWGGLGVKYTF